MTGGEIYKKSAKNGKNDMLIPKSLGKMQRLLAKPHDATSLDFLSKNCTFDIGRAHLPMS